MYPIDSEEARNRHLKRSVNILKAVLTTFLFIVAVTGVVGVVIYALFRVAVFDEVLYAYLFLAVFLVLFGYLLFRLVRRKVLHAVLRRTAWVFIVLCMVCGTIAAAFLYGSLFIRFPIVGFASAPAVLFCLVYLLPRLNLLKKLRRFFS